MLFVRRRAPEGYTGFLQNKVPQRKTTVGTSSKLSWADFPADLASRYGYNCRTMTHKPAHALKLNVSCAIAALYAGLLASTWLILPIIAPLQTHSRRCARAESMIATARE